MPMYLTELAPTALRGSMGVMCPLGITFGVLLGQVTSLSQCLGKLPPLAFFTFNNCNVHLGTKEAWPYCLSIYIVFVLFFAVATPLLPESPKYLFVVRKQSQNAVRGKSNLLNFNFC